MHKYLQFYIFTNDALIIYNNARILTTTVHKCANEVFH